jgi:hypothetical protein
VEFGLPVKDRVDKIDSFNPHGQTPLAIEYLAPEVGRGRPLTVIVNDVSIKTEFGAEIEEKMIYDMPGTALIEALCLRICCTKREPCACGASVSSIGNPVTVSDRNVSTPMLVRSASMYRNPFVCIARDVHI